MQSTQYQYTFYSTYILLNMGFPGFSLHLGDLLDLSMSNFTRISLGVWDFDPKLKKLEILGHFGSIQTNSAAINTIF